jgi:zinc protease
VHAFFARYYHPANASLVVAGDVSPDETFEAVDRYFGEVPPGPRVDRMVTAPVRLAGDRRLVLEDRVEYPRLYIAWHSPALFAADDAELDLAADVLANGQTSRLYRLLVRERRVAMDVAAYQSSRELSGLFQVVATAATADGLAAIDAAMREEVRRLATEGPSADEMVRAVAQVEAHFVYRLQTIGGFNGRSDQLNAYNTFLGDPGRFDRDLDRYRRATSASVREAMSRWLATSASATLSVVPRGRPHLALADSQPAELG